MASYEVLQPIGLGFTAAYGSANADVARGLTARMDRGTQFLSSHVANQLLGIEPSFAFVEQPQTNGVAERFIGTVKQ